ncbi:MAG: rRNA processing protein RimM [Pseudomonadota bacterium]
MEAQGPLFWQRCEAPEGLIELGRLAGPWGVKGWTKVVPYSQDADVLLRASQWYLCPPEGRFGRGFSAFDGVVSVDVAQCKPHGDGLVALIQGSGDRDVVAAIKGASVWVPRREFPPPADGEYYWVDLLGLEVVNRQGVLLGQVVDLMSTGPHAVLVLKDAVAGEAPERLIPFVPQYVDDVDLIDQRILVDWQADY